MDNIIEKIEDCLHYYDLSSDKYSEIDISEAITSILKNTSKEDTPDFILADIIAFELCEDYEDKDFSWGTFFGPKLVFQKNDGSKLSYPSIEQITPEVISCWEKRINQFSHPLIVSRYSSLTWEFSKIVTGRYSDYKYAQKSIDNIVDLALRNCYPYSMSMYAKLEYSLSLAQKLNDNERVHKVFNAILEYEKLVGEDEMPGLWGHAFEYLFIKNVVISDEIKKNMIDKMEERLIRVANASGNNFNPTSVEKASIVLANYYKRIGKQDDVKRVLQVFENTIKTVFNSASPMLKSSWLEKAYMYYHEFNLKAESERIANELYEIGPEMIKGMKQTSHSISIPKEDMDSFVEKITDGDFDSANKRIIYNFIPSKSEIEKQLEELSKTAPLSFHINKQIVDYRGRKIAEIGPLNSDRDGNIVNQMSQNINIASIFLRNVMSKVCEKNNINAEFIVNHLLKSPAYTQRQKYLLESGIKHYLSEDYIEAIHILVPQIEQAIRNLIEIAGGSVLKLTKSGAFQLATLDDLLRNDVFINIFSEDIALYFRVLLTDQRGLNVRNNLCHGLMAHEVMNWQIADRLIHIMLLLAEVSETS